MEKITKQVVYLPVKVEDELPEIDKKVFTFNTMLEGKVKYPPKDDSENISINCRIGEIPNKCNEWYDEYNFGMLYSKVNTWLKPQEMFVFTSEQFNEYTESVIKQALETAAEKAEAIEGWNTGFSGSAANVNQESISNTFDETFNKLKV